MFQTPSAISRADKTRRDRGSRIAVAESAERTENTISGSPTSPREVKTNAAPCRADASIACFSASTASAVRSSPLTPSSRALFSLEANPRGRIRRDMTEQVFSGQPSTAWKSCISGGIEMPTCCNVRFESAYRDRKALRRFFWLIVSSILLNSFCSSSVRLRTVTPSQSFDRRYQPSLSSSCGSAKHAAPTLLKSAGRYPPRRCGPTSKRSRTPWSFCRQTSPRR